MIPIAIRGLCTRCGQSRASSKESLVADWLALNCPIKLCAPPEPRVACGCAPHEAPAECVQLNIARAQLSGVGFFVFFAAPPASLQFVSDAGFAKAVCFLPQSALAQLSSALRVAYLYENVQFVQCDSPTEALEYVKLAVRRAQAPAQRDSLRRRKNKVFFEDAKRNTFANILLCHRSLSAELACALVRHFKTLSALLEQCKDPQRVAETEIAYKDGFRKLGKKTAES